MKFFYDGKFYKAIKISGPKHNLLAISFGGGCKVPEIIKLSNNEVVSQDVDGGEVLSQVICGLDKINEELGTNYVIEAIQYVPSDTPSKKVYTELTQAILKKLYEGSDFVRLQ